MTPFLQIRIVVLAALLLGCGRVAFAQQQFQGTCARVKIEILQTLTTERIGFEATLEITNNESQEAITDFSAELTFENPELSEDGQVNDASDFFFVRQPTLQNINRIDGTGVISPTRTAVVRWFIIPKPETGGTKPQGIFYRVGCRLGGKLAGVDIPPEQILVIPDTIQVKPEPRLTISYFQPRDVQGDDPFTPQVESPIPFTLGVLVKNTGYAPAKSVIIESEQPRIVENKQGLLLIAQLLGARVQDSPLDQTSLTVNLGDIPPGEARKGAWDMITSLSGEFVEFKASYTHASELGGEETSLIESLDAHFIAAEVLNDEPGRDDILDFLADTDRDSERIPDALYESNGNVLPVNHLANASIGEPLQGREFTVDLSADVEGWGYMRLSDPGQAKYEIEEVVRSDGKELSLHNVWTNIRYDPNTNAKLTYLNLFDRVEIGSYSYDITYAAVANDVTPPDTQLRFTGHVTEAEQTYYIARDTQMYFTSEDDNAVSIYYKVNNGPFKPGLPFSFDEPGAYEVVYYAEDSQGNVETESFARIVLDDAPPSLAEVRVAEQELFLKGDALSARPSSAAIDFSVPGNALPVDAQIHVFQGVRAFPTVSGIPVSPTPQAALELGVGGDYVDFYRYRVNGGAWSAESSTAESLSLSGLSGEVTLEVLGRSQYGTYPSAAEALSFSWTVNAASPLVSVDGLGPLPVTATSPSASLSGGSFEHYRWTIDGGYYRAPLASGESFALEALEPGEHVLDFDTDADGETAGSPEQSLSFTVDPSYGSDLETLSLVRSLALADIAGSSQRFSWDGRDGAGVLQRPGWYTVRVRVSNEIGQSTHATRIVRINDLAGGHQVLAGKASGPRALDARSGWAVWQERPESVWKIRARNLGAGASDSIYLNDDSAGQENPSTDGRWVAWQARRPNGSYDIELFDLENPAAGAQALTSTPDFSETHPVIDWPWVVFQRRSRADADAPEQLVALNLADGNATLEPWPSSADQLHADLHAGRVVWQDFRDVGNGEIYYADLESGDRRRLTADVFGQFFPAIRGDTVVWQDNRDGQVDLYRYDLVAGVESRLTHTDFDEAHPSLVDRFVIYEENSLGPETANLRILDLDTGLSVSLTRDDELNQFGGEAGGHLVWQRRGAVTDAQFELMEAPLPALQLIAGNYNAVPVTQALSDAYSDAYGLLQSWYASVGVDTVARYSQLQPTPQRQEALWDEGSSQPSGSNFSLEVGDFIWVRFGDAVALDLGENSDEAIALATGANLVAHTGFPSEYSAYELIETLGLNKVTSVRMLEARTGLWHAVQVREGALLGPNYRIPSVAVLMLEMSEAVAAWKPARD